jgi:hypothetical protein
MDTFDKYKLKEIILEKDTKFCIQEKLAKYELKNISVDAKKYEERMWDTLIYRLSAYIYDRKIKYGCKDNIKFPATCWEHFKGSFFPKWLLKYYPIKYTEVTTSVNIHLYRPEIPVTAPAHRIISCLNVEFGEDYFRGLLDT